jgi:hypothetical protein
MGCHGTSNLLFLLFVMIMMIVTCFVDFGSCHGGPTFVKYKSNQFEAEWVVSEYEGKNGSEIVYGNFTIKAPVDGMRNLTNICKINDHCE